ncbi:hypothetical protein DM01DRAFT_334140 [Hesseltinella vesiculosa]|uniref:Uncharacterized protein n=1 Tax=Hesseltinella vesiculosa TaxID=101127 RepID=A0A1X2GLX3_9FUNG|nr:hypothetical protein DM01DRAFT_334140 [Hesseltinella vesiculosa]
MDMSYGDSRKAMATVVGALLHIACYYIKYRVERRYYEKRTSIPQQASVYVLGGQYLKSRANWQNSVLYSFGEVGLDLSMAMAALKNAYRHTPSVLGMKSIRQALEINAGPAILVTFDSEAQQKLALQQGVRTGHYQRLLPTRVLDDSPAHTLMTIHGLPLNTNEEHSLIALRQSVTSWLLSPDGPQWQLPADQSSCYSHVSGLTDQVDIRSVSSTASSDSFESGLTDPVDDNLDYARLWQPTAHDSIVAVDLRTGPSGEFESTCTVILRGHFEWHRSTLALDTIPGPLSCTVTHIV